ncbi:MAG: DUF2179 domain-containing protein [Cyclobacteriaceae bacterium]
MDEIIKDLGITREIFNYIILPFLIFAARILDVSIATIRIIFVLHGNKLLAPIIGFFESFIWLVAIGQIIQNIDNFYSYIAFAGGFATGTLVGMLIEEKLALGNVVVRVITRMPAIDLITHFKQGGYHYTSLKAEGQFGPVNILFSVVKREKLSDILHAIKQYNPQAFYTIENVKKVSEFASTTHRGKGYAWRFWHLKRR